MQCAFLIRSIGGVIVDVVLSEKTEAEMEIANHPVERSAQIADHAWRKPRKVTIEGVTGQGAPSVAHEALLRLQDRPELMTIVTGLKVYSNMLLQSLSAERDKEHARILKFTAVLQEVIIVSTQTTSGSARSGSSQAGGTPKAGEAANRASGTVSRGEVQVRPAPTLGLSGARSEQLLQQYAAP